MKSIVLFLTVPFLSMVLILLWGVFREKKWLQERSERELASLRSEAEQGDRYAQWRLGCYYQYRVPSEAIKWYRMAAEQGNREAELRLGFMYLNMEDSREAVRWLEKAAEHGNNNAQYELALLYRDGKGIEQDLIKAKQWIDRAAERGHKEARYKQVEIEKAIERQELLNKADDGDMDAQYELGLMYHKGGTEQDFSEAAKWLSKEIIAREFQKNPIRFRKNWEGQIMEISGEIDEISEYAEEDVDDNSDGDNGDSEYGDDNYEEYNYDDENDDGQEELQYYTIGEPIIIFRSNGITITCKVHEDDILNNNVGDYIKLRGTVFQVDVTTKEIMLTDCSVLR